MRFARAVARVPDVRLLGVVHTPPGGADAGLFHDLVRVTEPLSARDILEGVEVLKRRHGQPYRIVGILEALMVQLGQARAHFGVPGTRPEVAELFRDKARMKDALRAAGLPVAKSALIRSRADAEAFAAEAGFPMVVKPPAGMGSKSTHRVESLDDLLRVATAMGAGPGNPVLAEEFLRGREDSYETLVTGGEVRVESCSRYLPGCLEAVENPWIQWCCLLPRDLSDPVFDRCRTAGRAAIAALGLDNGMTHMEWFLTPKGEAIFGEVACRPGGAHLTDQMNYSHDIDLFREWARVAVHQRFEATAPRKYNTGIVFKRAQGRGRITRIEGLGAWLRDAGHWCVEERLLRPGTHRRDWKQTLLSDGHLMVRHPDWDEAYRLSFAAATGIKMYAE